MATEKGELLDLLHVLVEDQDKENQRGVNIFELYNNVSGAELLELYLNTDEFRHTYSLALRAAFTLPPIGIPELRARFAGKLYHDLSFMYIDSKKAEGDVLLNAKNTLEFFRILYPNMPVSFHPLDLDSIWGITVPDGLLVRPKDLGENIAGVYEYTLTDGELLSPNKTNAFLSGKSQYKELFSTDAYCMFVVPQDSKLPQNDNETEIRVGKMPFSKKSFGSILRLRHIFSNGISDDPGQASINEIICYIRSMLSSAQKGLETGELSERDLSYLIRCPEVFRRTSQTVHPVGNNRLLSIGS